MYKYIKYYLQVTLVLLDFLLFNIQFFLTLYLFEHNPDFALFSPYFKYYFFSNISWGLLAFTLGAYGDSLIMDFEVFVKRTVQVYFLWVISVLFYLFIYREHLFSRTFILITLINFFGILFLNRFFYFGIKNYFKVKHNLVNKVIIVGLNDAAKKLASYFEEESLNTKLLGFVEDTSNIKELTNYPILANVNDTIEIAKRLDVQEIFSTIAPEQNRYIYTLINEAEKRCIRFKIIPDFSILFRKPVVIDFIKDMPVLSLRSDPMEDIGNRFKKRLLDIIVSVFVLIFILSWLFPLFGLLIVLESRGPILFSQLRTGKNDKPFYCFKFRSMKINDDSDIAQATKNDARVTKLGSFMRRTSLDEFPQFLNVLKGDMSLVGPRPHMIKHTNDFSKIIDHYMVRQFLKPGITGWAQINSFRGEIKNPIQLEMRIASDLWYLENWTIWLDLRIVFLTIYQVFSGDKNAY